MTQGYYYQPYSSLISFHPFTGIGCEYMPTYMPTYMKARTYYRRIVSTGKGLEFVVFPLHHWPCTHDSIWVAFDTSFTYSIHFSIYWGYPITTLLWQGEEEVPEDATDRASTQSWFLHKLFRYNAFITLLSLSYFNWIMFSTVNQLR